MFRRKKKDEPTDAPPAPETVAETESAAAPAAEASPAADADAVASTETSGAAEPAAASESAAETEGAPNKSARGNRVQKVGTVSSDKMQKTVIVRVDRQVRHPKYRRYVRRTSKFMAHDDLGATVGDRVRIIETRPLSAKKRWRVVEIVQKAAK